MKYISKDELVQILNNKDSFFIVDVREDYEYGYSNIGCKHIPMGDVCERKEEIPRNQNVLLVCKSGKRAEAVANYLETEFGYEYLYVLEGGLQAWKEVIDDTLKLD
ncbi:MAG: rhodanese-like domain-containing protein [Bacteroidota bacterium]